MLLGDRAGGRDHDGYATSLANPSSRGRRGVDSTGREQGGLRVPVTVRPVRLLEEDRAAGAQPGVQYATFGLTLGRVKCPGGAQIPACEPGTGRLVQWGDGRCQASYRGVTE